MLPVITKADLVTHDQLQMVTTDLGLNALKFKKERESIMDNHKEQNITIIAKEAKNEEEDD